ncbi:MAG: hypothetical protein NC094_05510 [Bacteroidales bacterium]|nr:hypothetical protein [Lachnoclostridium sp.]MCM1384194.1 hypothetical protein [Lachnoclostridium sp.]MCM1464860.1 hypothetical protein [Bacteroidales bacterium]
MKEKLKERFKIRDGFLEQKSLQRRDYERYLWKRGELAVTVIESAAIVCFLSYFFYRTVWAALPLSIVGILFFRNITNQKRDKCKDNLNMQFKECILSVAASLKAGYAVENAFLESKNDMCLLYGEDSLIVCELEIMRRGIVLNATLEEQLADLADRSKSNEIRQFAQVFSIAKRNGGSMPEIIKSSAELIGQRIDAMQEMKILLSGRQMEQNIMKIMPFAILAYIGITYPGYFDNLYHNLTGMAVMTGCLAIYLTAYALGEFIFKGIKEEML